VDLQPAMILDLFRPVHQKIREDLIELEVSALNWRPGPETNSVGSLVAHIVSTERRNLLRAIGADETPAENGFAAHLFSLAELSELVDAADQMLEDLGRTMSMETLSRMVMHPHRGSSSAFVLILQAYGHVKEHFGHLELTRQLYHQKYGGQTNAAAPTP